MVTECSLVACTLTQIIFSSQLASPDGMIGTGQLIEVKCPYKGFGQQIVANKKFSLS